ncbi:hypothetical protein HK096_010767 [Nowakowskiella sp. JEL0078]|nr:hypothetical protein HK096_010767 [Nowakowskiella sp. JEL0078]
MYNPQSEISFGDRIDFGEDGQRGRSSPVPSEASSTATAAPGGIDNFASYGGIGYGAGAPNPNANYNNYGSQNSYPVYSNETFQSSEIYNNQYALPSTTTDYAVLTTQASSRLTAGYTWILEKYNQQFDDKILSPTFGQSQFRWHLVAYTRGVGEGRDTHLGIFLRPLKNSQEEAKGDSWNRGILNFTIKIWRANDLISSETSAETFTGFNIVYPGWGFQQLLPFDAIPSALAYDGSLTIQTEVTWTEILATTSLSNSWGVTNYLQRAQASEFEMVSQIFGPENFGWQVHLFPLGRDETSHNRFLSLYIYAVPSIKEQQNPGWSRTINGFSIRLRRANSTSPTDLFVGKTLTGGTTFNASSISCGWAQFLDIQKVNDAIGYNGELYVETEVSWDETQQDGNLQSDSSDPVELQNQQAQNENLKSEIESLRAQLNIQANQILEKDATIIDRENQLFGLEKSFESSQVLLTTREEELSSVMSQLSDANSEIDDLKIRLLDADKRVEVTTLDTGRLAGKLAATVADLEELKEKVAENDQLRKALENVGASLKDFKDYSIENVTLKRMALDVKSKLARIRAFMEDNEPNVTTLLDNLKDDVVEEDIDVVRQRMNEYKSQIYVLIQQLAKAQADFIAMKGAHEVLQLQLTAEKIRNAGVSTIEINHESAIERTPELQVALENLRTEIASAKVNLQEVNNNRIIISDVTKTDRASKIAELAMVQAELDVARANVLESEAIFSVQSQEDLDLLSEKNRLISELLPVMAQLMFTRASLEDKQVLVTIFGPIDEYFRNEQGGMVSSSEMESVLAEVEYLRGELITANTKIQAFKHVMGELGFSAQNSTVPTATASPHPHNVPYYYSNASAGLPSGRAMTPDVYQQQYSQQQWSEWQAANELDQYGQPLASSQNIQQWDENQQTWQGNGQNWALQDPNVYQNYQQTMSAEEINFHSGDQAVEAPEVELFAIDTEIPQQSQVTFGAATTIENTEREFEHQPNIENQIVPDPEALLPNTNSNEPLFENINVPPPSDNAIAPPPFGAPPSGPSSIPMGTTTNSFRNRKQQSRVQPTSQIQVTNTFANAMPPNNAQSGFNTLLSPNPILQETIHSKDLTSTETWDPEEKPITSPWGQSVRNSEIEYKKPPTFTLKSIISFITTATLITTLIFGVSLTSLYAACKPFPIETIQSLRFRPSTPLESFGDQSTSVTAVLLSSHQQKILAGVCVNHVVPTWTVVEHSYEKAGGPAWLLRSLDVAVSEIVKRTAAGVSKLAVGASKVLVMLQKKYQNELESERREEEERIAREKEELELNIREKEEKDRINIAREEQEKANREREEQERLALLRTQEEQERTRLALEEQERIALRTQEEQVRILREEEEKLALLREQEEQERLRLEDEERLRRNLEEQERIRREHEEQERIRREQEEQERIRREQEEQDRIRREQEEKEQILQKQEPQEQTGLNVETVENLIVNEALNTKEEIEENTVDQEQANGEQVDHLLNTVETNIALSRETEALVDSEVVDEEEKLVIENFNEEVEKEITENLSKESIETE